MLSNYICTSDVYIFKIKGILIQKTTLPQILKRNPIREVAIYRQLSRMTYPRSVCSETIWIIFNEHHYKLCIFSFIKGGWWLDRNKVTIANETTDSSQTQAPSRPTCRPCYQHVSQCCLLSAYHTWMMFSMTDVLYTYK